MLKKETHSLTNINPMTNAFYTDYMPCSYFHFRCVLFRRILKDKKCYHGTAGTPFLSSIDYKQINFSMEITAVKMRKIVHREFFFFTETAIAAMSQ